MRDKRVAEADGAYKYKTHHAVRPRQRNTQPARARRQEEGKHRLVAVEPVDQRGAGPDGGGAIHAEEAPALVAHEPFQDVQRLARLREEEHTVALPLPAREHLGEDLFRGWVYVVGLGWWDGGECLNGTDRHVNFRENVSKM